MTCIELHLKARTLDDPENHTTSAGMPGDLADRLPGAVPLAQPISPIEMPAQITGLNDMLEVLRRLE
jgi:hypothetical protein